MDTARQNLKTIVRGAYDIQKMRTQMGNRIVANFKTKMGVNPGTPERSEDIPEETVDVLYLLKTEYKNITEGILSLPRKFIPQEGGVISNMTDLVLVDQYMTLEKDEAKHFRQLGKVLEDFPIYTDFLKKVKGVGPAMAGVIISEIDISKAKYSSSLWKYAGLDVASDGKGRSRKAEHLEESEYVASDGTTKTKKGITFNPFLKTKLVGVLGSAFLRAGKVNNPYREIYDNYRHRLDNNPAHDEKSKGHKHNMAIRYMVKMFIIDLYAAWKECEGQEAFVPYHEAKLGLVHTSA